MLCNYVLALKCEPPSSGSSISSMIEDSLLWMGLVNDYWGYLLRKFTIKIKFSLCLLYCVIQTALYTICLQLIYCTIITLVVKLSLHEAITTKM